MSHRSKSPVRVHYYLEPGCIFVVSEPTVISTALGSCVSVCVYDKKRRAGGMNHFQFPHILEKQRATARYGNAATSALIQMMIDDGSKLKHLEAQIFGGAYNPRISPKDIGRKNVMVARKILLKKRIHIVSEDVFGEKGRKIILDTHTNEVAVLKVEKLRKKDWYPYENG